MLVEERRAPRSALQIQRPDPPLHVDLVLAFRRPDAVTLHPKPRKRVVGGLAGKYGRRGEALRQGRRRRDVQVPALGPREHREVAVGRALRVGPPEALEVKIFVANVRPRLEDQRVFRRPRVLLQRREALGDAVPLVLEGVAPAPHALDGLRRDGRRDDPERVEGPGLADGRGVVPHVKVPVDAHVAAVAAVDNLDGLLEHSVRSADLPRHEDRVAARVARAVARAGQRRAARVLRAARGRVEEARDALDAVADGDGLDERLVGPHAAREAFGCLAIRERQRRFVRGSFEGERHVWFRGAEAAFVDRFPRARAGAQEREQQRGESYRHDHGVRRPVRGAWSSIQ
mmetsp:Transcript_13218/g.39362  ORF Transcript_13218/g.39362 Transcript_13218/m.39362 type:complete len:344 (-) Transcript_13218:285-1316(-)